MLKELKLSHGFEREKKEALTVAQQKLFFDYMLSHPKDTHWYPVFYVMANTGMRVGEITGLRWNDIDLKRALSESITRLSIIITVMKRAVTFPSTCPRQKPVNEKSQ